jgi:DNA-binding LytR/AlgR family response regulator
MKNATVLIVEDDLLIAEHLKALLEKEGGYNISIAASYEETFVQLEKQKPCLALLDVNLSNGKNGIDIARQITKSGIAFIYITAQSEEPVVTKIIETKPLGYILKPFSSIQVTTAVKIALQQIEKNTTELFDGKTSYRLNNNDILYIKAEGNYVDVILEEKKITLRNSLKKILPILPQESFFLANRSYIVNKKHIQKTTSRSVFIQNMEIAVTKD